MTCGPVQLSSLVGVVYSSTLTYELGVLGCDFQILIIVIYSITYIYRVEIIVFFKCVIDECKFEYNLTTTGYPFGVPLGMCVDIPAGTHTSRILCPGMNMILIYPTCCHP
jgi:hypothetical protein